MSELTAHRRLPAQRFLRVAAATITVMIAGVLVGCAPAGTSTSTTTTPGSSTTPASGSPQACGTSSLTVVANAGGSASGHRAIVLVFTNTGAAACRLHGYPSVAALDSHDTEVAHAQESPSGYLGGLGSGRSIPDVDLTAGQSASAMVESLAFNASDGSACTPYAGLSVTPPGQTPSIRLAWIGDGCSGLQIHPVVPGVTGQLA